MSPLHPRFKIARRHFWESASYLQHAGDAIKVLERFQKTVLMTPWQRENCTPKQLQGLIEWYAGRPVSPGAIVVAAAHLGFQMAFSVHGGVSFTIFARQLEGELRSFRVREVIKQAVGAN